MIPALVWNDVLRELRESSYNVRSLLVSQGGELLLEEYLDDFGPKDVQKLYSCTKSISSLLLLIAIQEKEHLLQEPLEELLPGFQWNHDSDRKGRITLEHVLNQTTGLKWQEAGRPFGPGHSGWEMEQTSNWVEYVLGRESSSEPGKRFAYNTGVSHLMSYLIEEISGEPVEEFAQKYLFGPLEITNFTWSKDPKGYVETGKGLCLTPNDLMKIGLLMMKEGQWNGKQILEAKWVRKSLSVQSKGHMYYGTYGYQWWLKQIPEGPQNYEPWSKDHNVFCAIGFGGQFLFMVPVWDLCVVFTGNLIGPEAFEFPQKVFREKILLPLQDIFA